MKSILLTTFTLFLSVFVYSQILIENPKIGMSTASNVKIEKIELSDTATVLSFRLHSSDDRKFLIPSETYIQPVGSKEKLFVFKAEGLKIGEWVSIPASGDIYYSCFFQRSIL